MPVWAWVLTILGSIVVLYYIAVFVFAAVMARTAWKEMKK